jgi:death-on-curing family protein
MKNINNKITVIYQTKTGKLEPRGDFNKETIWATQANIVSLFGVDQSVISRHIKNIFKDKEIDKKSNMQKMHIANSDKPVTFYSLDVVLGVGYRTNSKVAIEFRKWATKTLRNYITSGYILNQKRIKELKDNQLNEFKEAVGLIKKTIETKQVSSNETKGLLQVITEYANTWAILQQYDEDKLQTQKTAKVKNILDYNVSHEAILTLKDDLIKKKEASDLFGREREEALKSILGNINQSFGGKELYPSIEEKASHLIYFVIKNHPFTDGNKRIGSLLFILFLARNKYLFNKKGEKKFSDNALVALALLVAESDPKQKDVIIKLIINFIAN